jgi:hypothetical protein
MLAVSLHLLAAHSIQFDSHHQNPGAHTFLEMECVQKCGCVNPRAQTALKIIDSTIKRAAYVVGASWDVPWRATEVGGGIGDGKNGMS